MPDDDNLKLQRDRFLAFAFASADLFVEVSAEGKITYITGAPKSMTGIDETTLVKKNWIDLFSAYEQSKMQRAREIAKPGGRVGPILVTLNEQIARRQAVFTGIKMPDDGKFYFTLGVSNDFIAKIAPLLSLPGSEFLTDPDAFADAARDALFNAKLWSQDVEMTFFDFGFTSTIKEKFGAEDWPKVQKLIGETLAVYSFGGNTAGEIAEGRYSLVHERAITVAEIKEKITEITRQHDPSGKGAEIADKTLSGNLKDISKREISRSVNYAIDKFEEKGAAVELKSFKSGYDAYLSENEQKLKEFKGFIERVNFIQFFQPVVKISNRELSHYEILTRFEKGNTEDWVRFGEDSGLSPDFDLAVCERAINYIKFKAGGTRTRFSINLSAQSIANNDFVERLKEQLGKQKGLNERLMFEITESMNIENFDRIAFFIKEMRISGYKIALDDFSASTTCMHYLQHLKADIVKIDGRCIRRMNDSRRDAALVQHLAKICADMNIDLIAESVEDKIQADALAGLGVKFGQGSFYAAAGPKPDYVA